MSIDMLPKSTTGEFESKLKDCLVVFDLDRTLFDTNLFCQTVLESLEKLDRHEDVMQIQELLDQNVGNTFDLVEELDHRSITIPDASELMSIAGERPFLFDGVSNLLTILNEQNIKNMILTYGSLVGQHIKLDIIAAELEVQGVMLPPALITREAYKARWIDEAWQADDGRFRTPEEVSSQIDGKLFGQIIILDDKVKNLVSANGHIRGIEIDNREQGIGTPIRSVTLDMLAGLVDL